jgi:hypothetical protein
MAELSRMKQESRESDERALATGEKSRDDLRGENGLFVFPNARINYLSSRLS